MTSWIRATLPKKRPEFKSFLFETTDAGFCTNFNQFLYAHAYAMAEGRALEVYDLSNPVSVTFPLIKSTFSFEDISGVNFTDSASITSTSLRRYMPRIMDAVRGMPIQSLRAIAQDVFQWKESFIPTLEAVLNTAKFPAEFDLGIHIRVGDRIAMRDRRAVPVEDYLRAAKKFQGTKETLNIFLMSDSVNAITEFKKKADKSWKIYGLPQSLPNPEGHLQSQFNRAPARARLAAFHTFMAELLVMQSINDIICTFSSNVGRFLYYTVEFPERIISLDEKFAVK